MTILTSASGIQVGREHIAESAAVVRNLSSKGEDTVITDRLERFVPMCEGRVSAAGTCGVG